MIDMSVMAIPTGTKSAQISGLVNGGQVESPVPTLYGDTIQYTVTAVNLDTIAARMSVTVYDTVPEYLSIVPGSWGTGAYNASTRSLQWNLSLPNGGQGDVSFRATPISGACAAQPLWINQAYVRSNVTYRTTRTYHQGAGHLLATLSASLGGVVLNDAPHALDYTQSLPGADVAPFDG